MDLTARYPPPETPFSESYGRAHRAFVSDMLDSPDIMRRFADTCRLPHGYGVGLDERVVEYPWLLSRAIRGKTLDAGSTLNHSHILERTLPRITSLHIVTLAPEADAFVGLGVSYVFADLRALPFRDGYYDTVVSLSTLEHIGMDNSLYGDASPREADPVSASLAAVAELRRVLGRRGRLLITVPYGRREDVGWFRQFDAEDVEGLLEATGGSVDSVTVYAYAAQGWKLSSLRDAAAAVYRHPEDEGTASDRAAAARAVACIEMSAPGLK
jgi:SAM-dependent methyltransferase